jgi:hypothetical protein
LACQYDTLPGETRHQALKRKFEQVAAAQDANARVIAALRERPEAEAMAILRRLRDAEDIQSVSRHIEHGDLLLQLRLTPEIQYHSSSPLGPSMPASLVTPDNHYLKSFVSGSWASGGTMTIEASSAGPTKLWANVVRDPYQKPYHAAKVAFPQLHRVKPSQWTSVTTDDVLMRDLLHSYFLHEYVWYTFFQATYFLDDMANMCSDLCSPLLVNTVLALACVSPYLAVTTATILPSKESMSQSTQY